jgi:hypothetical protein
MIIFYGVEHANVPSNQAGNNLCEIFIIILRFDEWCITKANVSLVMTTQ